MRSLKRPVALGLLGAFVACGRGGPSLPTLTQPTGPVNIAGNFMLSITASSLCNIHSFGQTRSWNVQLTQSGEIVEAVVSGGNILTPPPQVGGVVRGNTLDFNIGIGEQIGDRSFYLVRARAFGIPLTSTGSFSGDLSGLLQTTQIIGVTLDERPCNASSHRFTFTKR